MIYAAILEMNYKYLLKQSSDILVFHSNFLIKCCLHMSSQCGQKHHIWIKVGIKEGAISQKGPLLEREFLFLLHFLIWSIPFFQIEKTCAWKKRNGKLGGSSRNRRSSLKNSKFRAEEGQEVSFTPYALVTNLDLGWKNLHHKQTSIRAQNES